MTEDATLFPAPGAPGRASQNPVLDSELEEVITWFRAQGDLEARFGSILRQSIDEVLDGQRTGRFDITSKSVAKTEKTYLGTKVEIVTRAAFDLPHGLRMDYAVAGHDVDAKFSLTAQWSIPKEAMGHICLVMAADDPKEVFKVGVVRINADILNAGSNQDGKKTITAAAKKSITWLVENGRLPRNLLLHLDEATRQTIMTRPTRQKRIYELFRLVQGEIIDRSTAVTVAQQHDGLKRCRDARPYLAKDGIVVLGHQNESPIVARALGLPVPAKGSFVSARLVEVSAATTDRPVVELRGRCYAVARPDEPMEPAPPIHY